MPKSERAGLVATVLLALLAASCQNEAAAQACLCIDSGALEPTCCDVPGSEAGAGDAGPDAEDSSADVRDGK